MTIDCPFVDPCDLCVTRAEQVKIPISVGDAVTGVNEMSEQEQEERAVEVVNALIDADPSFELYNEELWYAARMLASLGWIVPRAES